MWVGGSAGRIGSLLLMQMQAKNIFSAASQLAGRLAGQPASQPAGLCEPTEQHVRLKFSPAALRAALYIAIATSNFRRRRFAPPYT